MKKTLSLILAVLILSCVGVHAAGSTSILQKRAARPDPTLGGTAPYIPETSQKFTIGSTDFYYLQWQTAYNAGDQLDIIVVTNPGTTPPAEITVNISDEFGKAKLVDLGTHKTNAKAGTPYSLMSYPIPTKIPATFDFTSGYFNIVLSWTEAGKNYVKDRRVKINKVTADPGGHVNPALSNAAKVGSPSDSGNNNTTSSGGGGSSDGNAKKSAAATAISGMTSKCLLAIFIIQLLAIWLS